MGDLDDIIKIIIHKSKKKNLKHLVSLIKNELDIDFR